MPQPLEDTTAPMRNVFAAEDGQSLYLYEDIGEWWQAESVAAFADAYTGDVLHVRLHSFGGSAEDGLAIYGALRRLAANGVEIVTHADGACYSAAGLVFLAGDRRLIAQNAVVMLHAPYLVDATEPGAEITESDMAHVGAVREAMAALIAERTGQDAATIEAWLTAEYWAVAAKAVADNVATGIETLAAIAAQWPHGQNANQEAAQMAEPTNAAAEVAEDPTAEVVDEVSAEVAEVPTEESVTLAELAVLAENFDPDTVIAVIKDGSMLKGAEKRKAAAQAQSLAAMRAEIDDLKAALANRPAGAKRATAQVTPSEDKPVGAIAALWQ